jgi:hypothetical protein
MGDIWGPGRGGLEGVPDGGTVTYRPGQRNATLPLKALGYIR